MNEWVNAEVGEWSDLEINEDRISTIIFMLIDKGISRQLEYSVN